MSDRPSFRRKATPAAPADGRLKGMLGLLLLIGAALALRGWWEPRLPPGITVEVRGEVPRPGLHRLDETPTLREAVEAAGAPSAGLPETPLHEGDLVTVAADGVHVSPSGDPLLFALPVDINTADVAALRAIPGIGEKRAEAIVAWRDENGPFRRVADLERVPGLGRDDVEGLAGFVVVPGAVDEPPGPVDVNVATAAELETLPGIGPVTAARIVIEREDHGPFVSIDDLTRVKGVGPATVERLGGLAVVGPPVAP